ncbi:unnamed protein product, partial [Larinioides sclopetarius]
MLDRGGRIGSCPDVDGVSGGGLCGSYSILDGGDRIVCPDVEGISGRGLLGSYSMLDCPDDEVVAGASGELESNSAFDGEGIFRPLSLTVLQMTT